MDVEAGEGGMVALQRRHMYGTTTSRRRVTLRHLNMNMTAETIVVLTVYDYFKETS